MFKVLRPVCKNINAYNLRETKRFAGHSKWANIKHTKAEKDGEKSTMIDKHIRHMRAAVAEGGSANPEMNMKLAYLLEQAKKKNIPSGTIKAFLEKMQSAKINCHNVWINIQGPCGCLLVFHLITDNVSQTKHSINTMLRKNMCKLADGSVKSAFNIEGVITTPKFCDIDAATDIGIEIGAEEVSEFEQDGKTFLRFTCDPGHLMVVKRNLEKLGHPIISADDQYTPLSRVEVTDEGLEYISKLLDRIKATGELVKFFDNIA